MNEIQPVLIDFIKRASGINVELDGSTDLLTHNILDSLMLMDLVLIIETKWAVQLAGSDIAPSNFRTIENLSKLITERVGSATGNPNAEVSLA